MSMIQEGHYVDKKCPFTGNVSIRGAILKGMCISTKMKRTIIIRRNYLHYIKSLGAFFEKISVYSSSRNGEKKKILPWELN